METGPLDSKARPDRFATMDEIQAALSFLPDMYVPKETNNLWEVRSDLGGYVLIDNETKDDSILTLLEKLDVATN